MSDVTRDYSSRAPGLPPAGWRPDPSELETERYWDGSRWTPRVRDAVTRIERGVVAERYQTPVQYQVSGQYQTSGSNRTRGQDLGVKQTRKRTWPMVVLVLIAVYAVAGWYGVLPSGAPLADVLVRAAPTGPSVSYPVYGESDIETYIARHLIAQRPSIDLSYWVTVEGATADDLFAAASEAATQNPYVFAFQWSLSSTPVSATLTPDYVYSSAEADRIRVEMAVAVEMAVMSSGVTSEMSDHDKAAAIHDFIVRTASYDHAAADAIERSGGAVLSPEIERSQEAYGILVDGKAVCTGYAKAFVLLADAVGLESHVVTGWADGGVYSGSHAWNRVLIDGTWKVVDVTWNDYDSGAPGRDYFLLDDGHPLLATRTADN